MSESLQIRLLDVKDWLNKETKSALGPLNDKARGLLREIKDRADDTLQSSQRILDNSQSEMDKNSQKTHRFARNANKFGENLIETVKGVVIPDDFNYDKLYAFYEGLERANVSLEQLRRSAYPYISPYFIFDRRRLDVSFKRQFDITKELHEFLTTKYVKAKTVEQAYSLVDRLVQTLNENKKNEESKTLNHERQDTIERELAEVQQKIVQVQSRAELNELMKLNQQIKELRENVKHRLRYLQKPFFKLQSLARGGEVAVPPDELHKVDDYLRDPLAALAQENDGYPELKSVLNRLDTSMEQNKMKLKSTRLRKAHDQMHEILDKASLAELQIRGKEALAQKKRLLTSETVTASEKELEDLQHRLKELQKESEFAVSRGKSVQVEGARLQERTEHLKNELEKSILQLTNKNAQVDLSS
jgi:hypothetical protein